MRTEVDDLHHWRNFAVGIVAVATAMTSALAEASVAEPMRGVVRAVNQASLSTDVPMRLIRLPFREGHSFRSGDVIAQFDCRRSDAERQAVAASLREAQLNLEASLKLDGYKAVGKHELEVSRARVDKARGEHRLIEARLEDCIVRAPFAGRVADAPVRVWEFTAAQRPYLTIVEEGNLEIDFIIPSSQLAGMSVGQHLEYRVDEIAEATGKAIVTAIGPTVDPVSKTGKITAKVLSAPTSLAVGMSCTGVVLVDQR